MGAAGAVVTLIFTTVVIWPGISESSNQALEHKGATETAVPGYNTQHTAEEESVQILEGIFQFLVKHADSVSSLRWEDEYQSGVCVFVQIWSQDVVPAGRESNYI